MTKNVGFLVMFVSLALSQAACVAEPNDDGTGNDDSTGDQAEALSGTNLTNANTCFSKINALRNTLSPKPTAAVNIINVASSSIGGITWGDCAWKQAQYDSVNGGHAAHNSSTYSPKCLGTQNECRNWTLSGRTEKAMIENCVQRWFNEGIGGGHYTNMVSSNYKNITCGVYKNASNQYTITADFKMGVAP